MSHVERMKEEHKELKLKVGNLNAFIFGNPIFAELVDIERVAMIKQCAFMEGYLKELDGRIWRAHNK